MTSQDFQGRNAMNIGAWMCGVWLYHLQQQACFLDTHIDAHKAFEKYLLK